MRSDHSSATRTWSVAASSAILTLAGATVTPYLILYLHFDEHCSTPTTGLVVAAISASGLASSLFGGSLVDRFGARTVAAAGTLLVGLAAIVLFLARSLPEIVLASLVLGSASVRLPARQLAMAASLPEELPSAKFFSYDYMLINAAIAIGYLAGGLLIHLADPATFRRLLLVVLVASLVAACAYALLPASGATSAKGDRHRYRDVLVDPTLARYLGFLFLLELVSFASYQTGLVALVGIAFHQSPRVIAIGMIANPIVIVLGQRPMYALITRLGTGRAIVLTSVCFGASWLVLLALFLGRGELYDEMIVAAFALVFAVGEMAFSPVRTPLLLAIAPSALRGRYSGLSQLVSASAGILGPIAATQAIGQRIAGLWLPGLAALAGAAGLAGASVTRRMARPADPEG